MAATCRPTNPVPPVSATSMGCGPLGAAGPSRGFSRDSSAAALVQEYQRPTAPYDRRQGVVDRGGEHRPREVAQALDGPVGGPLLLIGAGGADGSVALRGPGD